jgi:hypothetical protein
MASIFMMINRLFVMDFVNPSHPSTIVKKFNKNENNC